MGLFAARLLWVSLVILPLSAAVAGLFILGAAFTTALYAWRDKSSASLVREGIAHCRPNPLGVPLAGVVLLGVVTVSTLTSLDPRGSLPSLGLAIAYLGEMWLVATLCADPNRLESLLRALYWGTAPWAVVGIVMSLGHFEWHAAWGGIQIRLGTWDQRANSVFLHPNFLAGYLLLAAGAGTAVAHWRPCVARRRPWHVLFALAILGACLVLTQSRSAWLGAAAMLAVLGVGHIWISPPKRFPVLGPQSPMALGAGLVLGFGFLGIMILQPHLTFFGRLTSIFDPLNPSNVGRLRVWQSALEMVAAKPLLGWGPGMWHRAYPPYRNPAEFENLPHAHSLFLHLGAEFGVLMVLTFVLLIGSAVARAARSARRTGEAAWQVLALTGALLGFLVMNLFEYTLSEGRNAIAFFAILGFLLAMGHRERRPEANAA